MIDEKTKAVLRKIRALKSMTTSAGCTEEEAALAAERVAKLMADYRIDFAKIERSQFERTVLPFKGVKLNPRASHPFVWVTPGVAHIAGAELYGSHAGLVCVGDAVGREIAIYLYQMTRTALNAEWRKDFERRVGVARKVYLAVTGMEMGLASKVSQALHDVLREHNCAFDEKARHSFMRGMAMRLATRMKDMPAARRVPEDIVKEYLTKVTMVEPKQRIPADEYHDQTALRAGYVAGDSVPISMGVGGCVEPQAALPAPVAAKGDQQ